MHKKQQNQENKDNRTSSRKYKLTLYAFIAATIIVLFPPLISAFAFKALTPLVILTGTEYITLISMVFGTYFGANVWQAKLLGNNQISLNKPIEPEKDDDKDPPPSTENPPKQ